jgi:hypothetical protein
MSSVAVAANAAGELADLPIETVVPTTFGPTVPVMATPAVALTVAAFVAGYQIGINLGQAFGRQPREPQS